METNLTIKHLSAYLPYGLYWHCLDKDSQEWEDIGLSKIDLAFESLEIGGMDIDISELPYPNGLSIKPILRPLSDLQKLIVEEFDKYDGIRDGKANFQIIDLFCEENGCYGDVVNIDLTKLPYECAIYIFENHYDFFGLIDKGLAIDINTL